MCNIEELQSYLDFRHEFLMDEYLKNHNDLECVYCGRKHLDIGYKDNSMCDINNKNHNLATIDHIIPLLIDDDRKNKSICVVACKKCNKRKGSTPPSEISAPIYGNMKIDTYKAEHFTGTKILSEYFNDKYSSDVTKTKKLYKIRNKPNIIITCSPYISEHFKREEKYISLEKSVAVFQSLRVNYQIFEYVVTNFTNYRYSSKSKNFYFNNGDFRLSKNWDGTNLSHLPNNNYHLAKLVDRTDMVYNFELLIEGFDKVDKLEYKSYKKNKVKYMVNLEELRAYKKLVDTLVSSEKLYVEIDNSKYLVTLCRQNKLYYILDGEIIRISNSKNCSIKLKNLNYTLYVNSECFPKTAEEYFSHHKITEQLYLSL